MIQHLIFLGEDIKHFRRVAFDFVNPDPYMVEKAGKRLDKEAPDFSYSIYSLGTHSEQTESVAQTDPFYLDVHFFSDFDELIRTGIQYSSTSAAEAAKVITEFTPCTPVQLQKLLYLAWSRYLMETGQPLFEEEFEIGDDGPFVLDIERRCKKYQGRCVPQQNWNSVQLYRLFSSAANGMKKFQILVETIDRYESCSADELDAAVSDALQRHQNTLQSGPHDFNNTGGHLFSASQTQTLPES